MKSEIKFCIQIIFLLKLIKADLISNLTLIVGNNTQYFNAYDNIESDYLDEDNQESEALSYIGCFRDSWTRDLDGAFINHPLDNSPKKCMEVCSSYNFKYSGLQDRLQCWCGDLFNKHGYADNCNKPCTGDPSVMCGGSFSNSIYQNNIEVANYETICESAGIVLSCPSGKTIEIKYAMFGRISKDKCKVGNYRADKCVSDIAKTTQILKDDCDLNNSCAINADPDIFGFEPCQSISKYLDIKYVCV